jgi:hypothetical protein
MMKSNEEITPKGENLQRSRLIHLSIVLMIVYVVLTTALITLRALVGPLDFLSVGWIILLALVPLLPWLIPPLAPTARRIAPFIKQVKLPGGVEISLAAAERPVAGLGSVETALTSDHLVHQLMDTTTPFTTTDAKTVIEGVQKVRELGAQAVLVDLGNGTKWRLPNLYFLAWIVANDPVTRWLVFTQSQGDISGIFVGMCPAVKLRRGIETTHPEYAAVGLNLEFHDPTQLQNQGPLAAEFNKIRGGVAPAGVGEVPTLKWVTTADLREMLGPYLVTATVAWTGDLDRSALETIVGSNALYVGATSADGRFRGLIEQREIVLEFARGVLTANS